MPGGAAGVQSPPSPSASTAHLIWRGRPRGGRMRAEVAGMAASLPSLGALPLSTPACQVSAQRRGVELVHSGFSGGQGLPARLWTEGWRQPHPRPYLIRHGLSFLRHLSFLLVVPLPMPEFDISASATTRFNTLPFREASFVPGQQPVAHTSKMSRLAHRVDGTARAHRLQHARRRSGSDVGVRMIQLVPLARPRRGGRSP